MARTLLNLSEEESFILDSYHSQNLTNYNFKIKRVYASISSYIFQFLCRNTFQILQKLILQVPDRAVAVR